MQVVHLIVRWKEGLEKLEKAFRKLAEYEDLEEQRKLLKLPCKIGDTVWALWHIMDRHEVYPARVTEIIVERSPEISGHLYLIRTSGYHERFTIFADNEFGSEFFLTQEEATATLQALKKEEEDEKIKII